LNTAMSRAAKRAAADAGRGIRAVGWDWVTRIVTGSVSLLAGHSSCRRY
jgi:hypothetical protein